MHAGVDADVSVEAPVREAQLELNAVRRDGASFREAQKSDPELARIPVVLLTADARIDEKMKALDVAGFLRKPVDLDRLSAVIRRYYHRP